MQSQTVVCPPQGGDAEAEAVAGEHACPSANLTRFSLSLSVWKMDSFCILCQDVNSYCGLMQILTVTFQMVTIMLN